MIRRFWFHFLMSLLILFVTSFLVRSHSRVQDIWITHIVYFVAVFVSIKYSRLKPKKVLAAYIAGFLIPIILVQVFENTNLLFQLNIISFLMAMAGGYIFATSSSAIKKASYVLLAVLYSAFAVLFLAERFLHYDNFKNLEGNTDEQFRVSGHIVNNTDTIKLAGNDKFIVLDFWTTSCGICFQKFPEVQKLYEEYKDDDRVALYAVNIPIKRDTPTMAEDMIRKREYTFPVYYAHGGIDTQLNVRRFPVTLLVKNNKIVARGRIDNIARILKEQLQ